MKYFNCLRFIVNLYLILFFCFGWTAPVIAQEASESAAIFVKEASKSASLFLDQPEIPSLRLPFDGAYKTSLGFGEIYPEGILKEGLEESKLKHNGIDFELSEGTVVTAVDDGEVVLAEDGDYGLTIKITHAWGSSVYGHLKQINIEKGQKVTKGQEVALSGSTGTSSGPHLHFGIKPKNPIFDKLFGFVDPAPYLPSSVIASTEGARQSSQELDPDQIASSSATPRNDNSEVAGVATASATITPIESGLSATSSAELTLPKAEKIATDSGYLFNYKFNLEKGTTAHFYDKASKSPSFAIADENYDYKLRFFLEQDTPVIARNEVTKQSNQEIATPSTDAQARNDEIQSGPKVDGNKVEFPVSVGGIPMILRYTLSGDKVKEEFIINEKPAEAILNKDENLNISFALSSEGLSRERVKEGYEFKSKDGTIVWRIANATIEDSNGKKGSPEDAYLEIDDTKAILGVKKEFLKNASYPVVIDPTWTQSTWDGGSGTSTTNQFSSSSSITSSVANELKLTAASSWYNTSWKYRRKITLVNTTANLGVTAETLTNFPILVKLTSSNLDFSKAMSSGQDIRFADSDGTTLLSYEIESWDSSAQTATVWVKVPSIDTTGTDYIYAYYGNSGASDAQSATNVWDSSTLSNWHFKEGTGSTVADSKSANTATWQGTLGSQWADGLIGKAGTFNGTNNYLSIATPQSLMVNAATVQFWVKTSTDSVATLMNVNAAAGAAPNILQIGNGASSGFTNELIFFKRLNNDHNANAEFAYTTATRSQLFDGNWHHVVMTFSGSSNGTKIYLDGASRTVSNTIGDQGRFQPGNGAQSANSAFLAGSGSPLKSGTLLDQVSFSNAARSAAWVAAEYVSQKSADSFNSYGSEEPQVATSGTLTSAIFDAGSNYDWTTLSYSVTTPSNTTASIKARTGNQSDLSDATAFSSCTAITSGAALSTGGCVTNGHRYIQYEVTLSNTDTASTPTFTGVTINYEFTSPSDFIGTVVGSDSIRWSWTDNSGAESGFYVQDTSGNTKCTVSSADTTTCTETGLKPGTTYTRNVVAYNSGGNSSASSNASATTRDLPVPSLISPADSSYINTERPVFKFQTPTDNSSTKKYSDVSTYKLLIGNADSTYITISNIPASRTTDYDGGTYIASYEGFSDSDITNNYITIYTKTSSNWSSTSNDGKLKSGKNTWYVASVDSAGNENAVSRIIYADYAKPAIVSFSSSDKLGEKDGYLILTERTPTITAEITDNLALDRVELVFSKENYLLGALISTDELFTQGYSLISADDNTDFLLRVISSRTLDLGSYSLTLKAYDEAGNESLLSTLKMKILTSEEAQQLLQGKVAEESQTTISLTDLEKKALLRREKEAAELQKFFEEIRTQLSFIFGQSDDVLLNWLADVQIGIEFVGSQVSILALGIKDASIDLAEGLYAQLAAVPTLVASVFNGVNNSITNSIAGMTDPFARYITTAVFVPVYRSTEQLLAGSRDAIAQVPLIGDQVLHLAEVTGDGVVRVATLIWQANYNISKGLDSSQDKVVQKVAASQQETTLSFISLSRGGGDLIATITGAFDNILLSSEGAVKEQIAQTNKQNLDFLAGAGLKLLETGNYLAQGVNKSLESSQDGVKDRIAQTHKGTSDKLAQTGEAIRIALRSIQKPAAETADFFYRFRVGVDTFQAIVFDEKPTMITDVTIEEIGTDYAVVSWKTNHFANGKVNYGSSLSYGEEVILEEREKYHKARLTGLKPGQRIFFEVMSQNKNYAYDAYYSFETLTD